MHFHHEGYPDCYEHEHDADTSDAHMQDFHPAEPHPAFIDQDDIDEETYAGNPRAAAMHALDQGRHPGEYNPEIDDPADYYEDLPEPPFE